MEIYFKFRPIKEHRLPCFACPLIAANASLLCMSAYCNKRFHALHVRLLQQTLPCPACPLIATNASLLCMSAYYNKNGETQIEIPLAFSLKYAKIKLYGDIAKLG